MDLSLQNILDFPKDIKVLTFLFSPDLDFKYRLAWLQRNWTYSAYASAIYVFLVFAGQRLMKNRQPFVLKKSMVLWNFALAAFSMVAFSVIGQAMFAITTDPGFYGATCGIGIVPSKAALYYGWLFNLSKIFELGDTVFLILRKRPVMLLHWYHHTTVLMYTWYATSEEVSMTGWFTAINLFVHSLMYTYYAFSAMGVKIPRVIAKSITLTQLSQMIVGIGVTLYVYSLNLRGIPCHVANRFVYLGLAMYASYFVLFGQFYIRAYMSNQGDAKTKKQT